MALSVRVQPISRDLELMMDQSLGPKARSAMLAAYAAEAIADAAQQNRQVLGVVPPYEVYVDGAEGAPLTSVKPDGVIRAEFGLGILNHALLWIYQQLEKHSPRLTGQYASSHVLLADGYEVSVTNPPLAEEYAFVNTVPYARKIEGIRSRGITIREPQSKKAAEGVYQVVAKLAQKFGNVAKISFSYREAPSGERNPAIIVKLAG
jgi:hypothetical protein